METVVFQLIIFFEDESDRNIYFLIIDNRREYTCFYSK